MKVVNGQVIIEGMKTTMPFNDYVSFTDGDCTKVLIEKDIILRLASLIDYEEERKEKSNA